MASIRSRRSLEWERRLHFLGERVSILGFAERGQALQRGAGDPVLGPVTHRLGAQTQVEVDGGLVPVEHGPFETAAAARARDSREMAEQCLADAVAAKLRPDEEIFEVEAGLGQEG